MYLARADGPFYAELGVAMQSDWVKEELHYPYGLMKFHDFIEFENKSSYQPANFEVIQVFWMLGKKGCPAELALKALKLAAYEPRSLLMVPHDPFHRENKATLKSYLSVCWDILIRCDMMGKVLGEPFHWDRWVSRPNALSIYGLSVEKRTWHLGKGCTVVRAAIGLANFCDVWCR